MTEYRELISIIVPVYKVEDYLNKCIESIRSQTYRNIEIILVDDGSPDQCPNMCDEYAAIDDRIKVIHQENGGLSSARNAGIDIAKGKYIGFVDSDDYIESTMYERMYEGIHKHKCDIAICNHYVEKGDKLLMEMPPVDQVRVYEPKEAIKLLLEDKEIRNYAWDKLYMTELFHGIRYPVGRNYEDIALTYRLFDKAKGICQLQNFGYYYQIRENSISNHNTMNKWHINCRDMVSSMCERFEYFSEKKDLELKELSLAKLLPLIITYLKLGYKLKTYLYFDIYKQFLSKHKEEIYSNRYISKKNKKLAIILSQSHWVSFLEARISEYKNKLRVLPKVILKIKGLLAGKKRFDFSLQPGKQVRIFLFDLPCFDNLGDHAIAYAQKEFFDRMSKDISKVQVIEIPAIHTVQAVRQLVKEIRDNDVFICQGGGNMGNLYDFAEVLRRKIIRAFPKHFIVVFPQTMYFTEDRKGSKELIKSKRVYNNCSNLTLLARDQVSYERMKKEFRCNIIPMVDVVTSIDATQYSSETREGSIICLRSDLESALAAEDKKKLYEVCEQLFSKNVVTDTVTRIDINENDREQLLKDKWCMFGKAEVVITDRLHGMIFALITETPCIILGNNHHKLKESYKTLAKSNYLYYVDSADEVKNVLMRMKKSPIRPTRTLFQDEFDKLYRYIVSNIHV